jgi:hypothetical protein
MDIVKMITSNSSIKNMLLEKFTGMAKEKGITRVMIDLTKSELELEEIKPNEIIVDSSTYYFLKQFYNENKNLINGNKL